VSALTNLSDNICNYIQLYIFTLGSMQHFLGFVTPCWDMCHYIGIHEDALDDNNYSISSSCDTWTIHRVKTF
jgi:hypothetical protein